MLVMELVACTQEYWEFVRLLRLDPLVSAGFIETNQIETDDQIKYMQVHQHEYRVALIDVAPVPARYPSSLSWPARSEKRWTIT